MWALTKAQRELLSRWFDDELSDEQQRDRAESLLDEQDAAELWVSVLRELQIAARGAFQEARARADLPSSDELTGRVRQVKPLSELTLDDLEPLLEAYHDDAVTEPERRAVEMLRDKRDDVSACLEELDFLTASVRAADQQQRGSLSGVDLWDGIEANIDRIDRQQLLMQYADDELDGEGRERVESMLEANEHGERQMLAGIRQMGEGVRAAHQEVVQTDLSGIWEGVDEALADAWHTQDEGADVVRLDAHGQQQASSASDERQKQDTGSSGIVDLFSNYGQAMVGAAAAVALMVVGGMLYQNFMAPGASTPRKQVVIVDDYQEKSASVQVRSVKQTGTSSGTEESKVIWLSDESNGKADKAPGGRDLEAGSQPSASPSVGGGPDAGGLGGENGAMDPRSNRDFPDGGTPIGNDQKGSQQVPAGNQQPQQLDKPGDGPI
jgi:hypothetical protein